MIQDLTDDDDMKYMKCLLNLQLLGRPSIHKSIGASHVDGNHSASGTMGSRHAKCATKQKFRRSGPFGPMSRSK